MLPIDKIVGNVILSEKFFIFYIHFTKEKKSDFGKG